MFYFTYNNVILKSPKLDIPGQIMLLKFQTYFSFDSLPCLVLGRPWIFFYFGFNVNYSHWTFEARIISFWKRICIILKILDLLICLCIYFGYFHELPFYELPWLYNSIDNSSSNLMSSCPLRRPWLVTFWKPYLRTFNYNSNSISQ